MNIAELFSHLQESINLKNGNACSILIRTSIKCLFIFVSMVEYKVETNDLKFLISCL